MPQLLPAPWFAILFFTWLVFLTLIVPKILAHTYPNTPTSQSAEKSKNTPWSWPWH
ncbi:ATP synthase F0 subunit 8 (mitochondrion) [Scophthalmus maximus]|uniref:ATP synthase complex subunit 8 n=1 Tax=Scophthalmus maximus TaxID=52904 RepID=C7S7B0_SCOMX|nr:ATP synthase F0 subunit 8 [Scophthalmus maximus]ABY79839.1 ATP synthase subunit 8 [Scophthalmus maximus]AEH05957.1 ATP synthase subunit 8 [Scophthalmus maximus]AEH05960.1 ATP synthase subunit 8 [Scophthalmus maximus]QIA92583.1 ATP synthase F0 subunit 8 [Scophthalmus maximus]